MLASHESEVHDHLYEDECQWCRRTLIARFGGVTSVECESCYADFERERRRLEFRMTSSSRR